jgi:hypothetical protein
MFSESIHLLTNMNYGLLGLQIKNMRVPRTAKQKQMGSERLALS